MAITATPYGAFLLQFAQGAHNLVGDPLNVALVKSDYTPNFTNDYDFTAQSAHEVANDTATGGYLTGGTALTNKALTYNASTKTATLNADAISWTALTGTFRYAVVLDVVSSGAPKMLGLLDFGADRTYSAETFTLSFPDGVLTLAGV